MQSLETQAFDFAALDELAFAAQRGRLKGRVPPRRTASHLGPVIELAQVAATGLLPRPGKAEWLSLDGLAVIYRVLVGGRSQWISPEGRRIGFFRTRGAPADGTAWTGFCLAAQQAASMAGFGKRTAQQLAAAIDELHSNIYEHSRAPETGLVAFRAGTSSFEFVVADRGVGILETLKTCPEFAHLRDHGEALSLALNDGVSRYGSSTGRGFGFRPIFVGLANIKAICASDQGTTRSFWTERSRHS